MKTLAFLATLAALAAAPAATAQSHHDHPAASQASSAAMADGEVRKVDRDAGKVTLKHGYIKSLDMPPMTMVFQASDAKLLDGLKVGDKVKFRAAKVDEHYAVTEIEPSR